MSQKSRIVYGRRQLVAFVLCSAVDFGLARLAISVYYSWWFLLPLLGLIIITPLAVFFGRHLAETIGVDTFVLFIWDVTSYSVARAASSLHLRIERTRRNRRERRAWNAARRPSFERPPAPFYLPD